MVMLIPVTVISVIYTIFFFVKISEIQVVDNNILTPESAKIISILSTIDVIIKFLSLIFTYNVYENLKIERKGISNVELAGHKQYVPLTTEEQPLKVTNKKFRPSVNG